MFAYEDYRDCVSVKATTTDIFGKHDKSPQQVAIAAEPACSGEWRKLRNAVFSGVSPSDADVAKLDALRSLAIGNASSDVIESRIGSCGSAAGPYQCRPLKGRSATRPR